MKKFFLKLLLYLNILFIACLLLSYLSVFISPEVFWIPAFFGLAYPVFLFINLLLVILWLILKKRKFLISLAVIMLGWGVITRSVQIAPREMEKEENPDISSFKLVTYNVRAFNKYKWLKNDETGNKILDFISESQADVLCIQEFTRMEAERLMKKFSAANNKHIHYTTEGKKHLYGLATFSAYPIVNKGYISLGNTKNGCIFSDIVVKEDTFRIYNSHLESIHLGKQSYKLLDSVTIIENEQQMKEIMRISNKFKAASIKRSRQAKEISEHIRKSPYPVIVCGDFNDTPVSYTYQKIKGHQLEDAFREAGFGTASTYAGKNIPFLRIDFVLHDDMFEPYNFKRHKINYSDHYPLSVDFVLPEKK